LDTGNLVYKKDGRLVQNKLKPLIKDLDVLPFPDRTVYPYNEIMNKLQYAQFLFTRGCPYHCSYCSNKKLGERYGMGQNNPRSRSPELCISEIEDVLRTRRFYQIGIIDDVFGINRVWLREFLKKYKERIRVKFSCLLRVEYANDELMAELKDGGCFKIFFGVESGNENIRKSVLNRKMTNEQIVRAFDLCRKHKLDSFAVNMIGLPGETDEMVWDTIRFNRKLRSTTNAVNIFYPYMSLLHECPTRDCGI
jgi:radical SAM superfamily enzyme YgiQ (UPF0313 family)